MPNKPMTFIIKPDSPIQIEIGADQLITGMNTIPIIRRWTYIAMIFNAIDLEDISQLTDKQKEAARDFLKRQYERFE